MEWRHPSLGYQLGRGTSLHHETDVQNHGDVLQPGRPEVHLWNLANVSLEASVWLDKVLDEIWGLCVRFSPDGKLVAVGSLRQLSIFRGTDLRRLQHFIGLGSLLSLRFNPDGRHLVSGHGIGGDMLILWDTDTWQQLARYKPPIQDIGFITFSPDGNDLLTSDANALRVWRAASVKDIAGREARLGRWR